LCASALCPAGFSIVLQSAATVGTADIVNLDVVAIMKTASEEIRSLVVKAYISGVASREQLAAIFGYHIDSIGRWIRVSRQEKRLAPLPRGHRLSTFNLEEREKLVEFIEKHPNATLEEIRKHVQKRCSLAAIHNIVSELGYVLKKNLEGKRTRTRGYSQIQGRTAHVANAEEYVAPCIS